VLGDWGGLQEKKKETRLLEKKGKSEIALA